jgi:hypothetical protein
VSEVCRELKVEYRFKLQLTSHRRVYFHSSKATRAILHDSLAIQSIVAQDFVATVVSHKVPLSTRVIATSYIHGADEEVEICQIRKWYIPLCNQTRKTLSTHMKVLVSCVRPPQHIISTVNPFITTRYLYILFGSSLQDKCTEKASMCRRYCAAKCTKSRGYS